MGQLFTRLTEEFDGPSGTLINYVGLDGTSIATRRHYDIREFIGDDISVPNTMLDLRYSNITTIDGTEMIVLDSPRFISGRTITARPISQFDGDKNTTMDTFIMQDLDIETLTTGNENWPIDAAVTVGADSSERWANSIQITLVGGTTKTVSSIYQVNIRPGMETTSSTYLIELALPSFPAQAAGTHLDLTNSFIDFSSDDSGGYDPTQTDSFTFASSLNSLTAGGNTYWQINRNSLVNTDITNIQGIRFRLKSVGNMTFKAQALRVYKSDEYTFDSIDTDTERGQLKRSVPRDSGTELTNPIVSTYMMNDTRPKNFTMVGKLNSGHIDSATDSSFTIFGRNVDINNYLSGNILVNNSRTLLTLKQNIAGTLTTLGSISLPTLTANAFYLLVLQVYEDQATLSLYNSYGAFYGTLVGTTGSHTAALITRGRVGFDFKPYNYDFYVDYLTSGDAEFGRFESKVFNSVSQIIGATIAAEDTGSIDLTQGHFIPAGDADISIDFKVGNPIPSVKFVRDGSQWQGGYVTDKFLFIGNPLYLKIVGQLFPVLATGQTTVRGQFRIIFIDKWGSVGYIANLRNLLPSQWNSFEIPLNSGNLAPGNYQILIQQTGFYPDTFYIDNLQVFHLSFSWEASPNAGTNWYKFLTATDTAYSAVNFKSNPGNELQIRATALSDDSWISDYELIPFYGVPGQTPSAPLGASTKSTIHDVRVTGAGTPSSRAQDVRITGVGSANSTVRDVRVTGQLTSSIAQNVRVTASGLVPFVNDVRVTGQNNSSQAQDIRITGTNGSNLAQNVRITGSTTGQFRGLLGLTA